MQTGCFISIDQGSSSTKVVAVNTNGQIFAETRTGLSLQLHDDIRIEQNADDIVRSTVDELNGSVQAARDSGMSSRAHSTAWSARALRPI